MTLPRGIRNRNPLNIRYNSDTARFVGCTASDGTFCIFDIVEHGLRAAAVILMNYQTKYHLRSIRQIISRWAPPEENDTEAYIASVVKSAGLGPDSLLTLTSGPTLAKLLPAMVMQENGVQPYSPSQFQKAIELAGGIQ